MTLVFNYHGKQSKVKFVPTGTDPKSLIKRFFNRPDADCVAVDGVVCQSLFEALEEILK